MANYNIVIGDTVRTTELVRSRYLRNGTSGIYQARFTPNKFVRTADRFTLEDFKIPVNCSSTSSSTTALEALPNIHRLQLWDLSLDSRLVDDFTNIIYLHSQNIANGLDRSLHMNFNDDAFYTTGLFVGSDDYPHPRTYYPDGFPAFQWASGTVSHQVFTLSLATDTSSGSPPFQGSGTTLNTALIRIDLGANVNFPGDGQDGMPFGPGPVPIPHPSGTIFVNDTVHPSDSVSVTRRNYSAGITPRLDIYEWDLAQTTPSGQRHVPSGSFAFKSYINSKGYLDFGVNQQSTKLTSTKCMSFKVHKEVVPFGVTNCKLWVGQASGLGVYPTNISVNAQMSNIWHQNYSLASGVGSLLSSALPAHQNVLRNDSSVYMDGGSLDQYNFPETDLNTSQYMYLSINHNPALLSNGVYGFGGAGALKARITYDYFAFGYYWDHKW